jgi:hypothetical protein
VQPDPDGLTAELDAAEAIVMHGAMTRGEFRDAVVHAMRHLRHPYVNGAACVEEILAAADRYARGRAGGVL